MWVYILIAILFIYALYKERQALGCPNIPDGTDCDNANGKPIRGTNPEYTDSDETVYDKIKRAADFSDKWVIWRFSIILSFFTTVIIYFFTFKKFPSEYELTIGMFVTAGIVYFIMGFYKFHLFIYAKDNVVKGVDILRTRKSFI